MVSENDPHHCRCFSIVKEYFSDFEKKLKENGFVEPLLEEDHGQILGLTKRLNEYTQIHVKLLSDGKIESEMEYPPDYPFAHINQEHSYSAHSEVREILDAIMIPYSYQINPPTSCLRRKIIQALNPTHAGAIILGTLLGVALVGILSYFMKDEDE